MWDGGKPPSISLIINELQRSEWLIFDCHGSVINSTGFQSRNKSCALFALYICMTARLRRTAQRCWRSVGWSVRQSVCHSRNAKNSEQARPIRRGVGRKFPLSRSGPRRKTGGLPQTSVYLCMIFRLSILFPNEFLIGVAYYDDDGDGYQQFEICLGILSLSLHW